MLKARITSSLAYSVERRADSKKLNAKRYPLNANIGSWIYFGFCVYMFIILISGCAAVIEGAKGVAGTSTRALEKGRKNAIVKTFNYDYSACYARTLEILKHINAYVYKRNIKKHMIAVYVSEEDTTQVGIFFKEIDASHTQIEVSSRSTYAKETISSTLFSSLEKSPQ